MNVKLPAKMPTVVGRGPIAAGFRIAFGAIDAILQALSRMEVKSSDTVDATQTSIGTVLRVKKVEETTVSTKAGPARWS